MTSTVLLKHGKNDGTVAYNPKETAVKEMAAKISKLSQIVPYMLFSPPKLNFIHI
jgi:hypothetical protein